MFLTKFIVILTISIADYNLFVIFNNYSCYYLTMLTVKINNQIVEEIFFLTFFFEKICDDDIVKF